MIFPEFDNIEIINSIRKKYDPLAELVKPHVTLVFPFRSELTAQQINESLQCSVHDIRQFELKLSTAGKESMPYGHYIYINVITGREELTSLHKRLYNHLPCTSFYKEIYTPHMTLGRFDNEAECIQVYEKLKNMNEIFQTIVKKISVEIIGEHQESIIETEYLLKI